MHARVTTLDMDLSKVDEVGNRLEGERRSGVQDAGRAGEPQVERFEVILDTMA